VIEELSHFWKMHPHRQVTRRRFSYHVKNLWIKGMSTVNMMSGTGKQQHILLIHKSFQILQFSIQLRHKWGQIKVPLTVIIPFMYIQILISRIMKPKTKHL